MAFMLSTLSTNFIYSCQRVELRSAERSKLGKRQVKRKVMEGENYGTGNWRSEARYHRNRTLAMGRALDQELCQEIKHPQMAAEPALGDGGGHQWGFVKAIG
jgi:hypothetical protein